MDVQRKGSKRPFVPWANAFGSSKSTRLRIRIWAHHLKGLSKSYWIFKKLYHMTCSNKSPDWNTEGQLTERVPATVLRHDWVRLRSGMSLFQWVRIKPQISSFQRKYSLLSRPTRPWGDFRPKMRLYSTRWVMWTLYKTVQFNHRKFTIKRLKVRIK